MRDRIRIALGVLTVALAVLLVVAASPQPAAAEAPAPPARAVAEWEPAFGTLIRWPLGIPSSLVVELAEDDSLYVLVETSGQESQARYTFSSWDVNLDHCRFIRTNTYSHWTRDWGPHSVFDGNGEWGITDPWFNGYPWVPPAPAPQDPSERDGGEGDLRGYEEDDAVNAALAEEFDCGLFRLPAYCTGGNFMTDGQGRAFSSWQMYRENEPYMGEQTFRDLAQQYLGIQEYTFLNGTEDVGIQHIDCWAKMLDEETILVKRPPVWHEEYDPIETNIDILEGLTNCYGRPYNIVRIDTPPYDGYNVAAYTNSLILNNKVLVPLFGISGDQAALQTYQDAMPGYEVLGFYGSWYYYDALHCRTMAIFDRHMVRMTHRRLDAEMPFAPEYEIAAFIDDRSEAGLDPTSLRVQWRLEGESVWNPVSLAPMAAPDSFLAVIPGQAPGVAVEYYLEASDLTGRHETLPPSAPDGFYRFEITGDPSGVDARVLPGLRTLSIAPNPSVGEVTIRLSGSQNPEVDPAMNGGDGAVGGPDRTEARGEAGQVANSAGPTSGQAVCRIVDAAGRQVRILRPAHGETGAGWTWDGLDDAGASCPAGVYWALWSDGKSRATGRLVRIQ